MNLTNLKNLTTIKNFQTLQTARKLLLWFILSLAVSVIFLREFWLSLPNILSPRWIFVEHHVSPWAVLALCLIFLWLKRREVWGEMLESSQVRRLKTEVRRLQVGKLKGWECNFMNLINLQTFKLVVGMVLVVGAVLMPSSRDYLVFQVLLASLGVFVILFGRGAKIPAILLAIYGFAISFPLAIERFAEAAASKTAIVPVMAVMTFLGYPLQNQGQWLHFTSSGGEPISVAITAACGGSVSMAIFIASFALMMLDMPLPPKKAVWLFLFGAVGTWVQDFVRLIILMLVSYHLGKEAMWTAHFWSTYIVFPSWFFLFVYIYFRQVGGKLKIQNEAV